MVLRAVLDTSVIVSGIIRPRGTPGQILERILDDAFVLVVSPPMMDELRRTLKKPRIRRYTRWSDEEIDLRTGELEMLADPFEGKMAVVTTLRDPDDLMFLVAAIEGRASYIVTGDEDLLTLQEYEGISIVTPRAFLDLLTG